MWMVNQQKLVIEIGRVHSNGRLYHSFTTYLYSISLAVFVTLTHLLDFQVQMFLASDSAFISLQLGLILFLSECDDSRNNFNLGDSQFFPHNQICEKRKNYWERTPLEPGSTIHNKVFRVKESFFIPRSVVSFFTGDSA